MGLIKGILGYHYLKVNRIYILQTSDFHTLWHGRACLWTNKSQRHSQHSKNQFLLVPLSHAALACRGFSEEIAHLIPVSKGSFFHRHIHWWNKGFVWTSKPSWSLTGLRVFSFFASQQQPCPENAEKLPYGILDFHPPQKKLVEHWIIGAWNSLFVKIVGPIWPND